MKNDKNVYILKRHKNSDKSLIMFLSDKMHTKTLKEAHLPNEFLNAHQKSCDFFSTNWLNQQSHVVLQHLECSSEML